MYDEDFAGNALRDLMLAVDMPPSGADVHRATANGRRQVRRRTIMTSGAAGIAVIAAVGTFVAFGPMRAGPYGNSAGGGVLSAPPKSAPTNRCTAAELPLPAGVTDVFVAAIDPTGTIVAGQSDPQPTLWKDGKAEKLPGVSGTAVAVAADGTVVGYATNEQDNSTGWVFRNGAATNLAKLSGYKWTNPNAVNAHGEIAGWVHGASLDDTAPVLWSADGTVHKLTVPHGVGNAGEKSVMARDIADDGTVVGSVHGVPMLWEPGGTPQALPLPAGVTTGAANAIAGHYVYGTAGADPARWDLSTGKVTLLQSVGDFGAKDGTADGAALLPATDNGKVSLLVGLDGRADPLTGPKGARSVALAVSTDGSTVAGMTLATPPHPLLWHCR